MEKYEFYNNPRFHHVQHPLIEHKLAILRDIKTDTKLFNELVEEISTLEAYEATKDLPLEEIEVQTPLETATCSMVSGRSVALI